jgi:hypothetical protein
MPFGVVDLGPAIEEALQVEAFLQVTVRGDDDAGGRGR